MAMDSDVPSSIWFHFMMATILITTIITQKMAMQLWIRFPVAINRMMNENTNEIIMPFTAFLTNALSIGIQGQIYAVW